MQEGVQAEIAQGTLGSYLHDLGKVLYFRDDPDFEQYRRAQAQLGHQSDQPGA